MSPAAPAAADFVHPLALASLLTCAVTIAGFLLQALLAGTLAGSGAWRALIGHAAVQDWPGSLRWVLAHPVATSLSMAAACVPSLVSSWGLLKGHRWGLLGFVGLLGLTALGNLALVGWLERMAAALLPMAALVPRMAVSALLLGSGLLLAGAQGWLAWRLLRPDIQARFPPR